MVWYIQGVMPDPEMESLLINIFGRRGHPVRKYWRMMYWMPKFKNISPWPLPNPVPNDSLELAKLALERMSSVDLQSKVTVYQVGCNLTRLLVSTIKLKMECF
jgi:signaling intermediate in Toll pathway protein